jgi:hypothetical protein
MPASDRCGRRATPDGGARTASPCRLIPAEYVAVARLQADFLVASDPELATAADGLGPLAEIDAVASE